MIISPTEPAKLRRLGDVSMFPETFGCDILIASPAGWVGVQRKEIRDLIASIYDRRLGEQVAKMSGLAEQVLVIEGKAKWSADGELIGDRWTRINRATLRKIMWGLHRGGVWIDHTDGIADTAEYLTELEQWAGKAAHRGLGVRGSARSQWGTANSRDWQSFMLQGLPGVGPDMADRILDQIGMPIGLTEETVEKLSGVKGVGPKTVKRILEALPVFNRDDRDRRDDQ